jgi:hypothetical protein
MKALSSVVRRSWFTQGSGYSCPRLRVRFSAAVGRERGALRKVTSRTWRGLGGGAGAVFFGEEDVVVLAGVEGRVEVDEVDGLVGDVVAEDGEVVSVIELVWGGFLGAGIGVMLAGEWVASEAQKDNSRFPAGMTNKRQQQIPCGNDKQEATADSLRE